MNIPTKYLDDFEKRVGIQQENTQAPAPTPAEPPPMPEKNMMAVVNQPEFTKAFPNATAFLEGIKDSVTFGASSPSKTRDLLSAEGMAEAAGMVVGEIPFWMVGGGVAKTLISKGIKAGRRAAQAAEGVGVFGKTVKLLKNHGVAIGEAGTAVGVDVGRATIGGDEDALSPFRLAVDVSVPFAQSLMKIGKTRGVRKAQLEEQAVAATRMAEAREKFMQNVHNPIPKVIGDTPEGIRYIKQRELDEVFKALPDEDAQAAQELSKVFTVVSGDEKHVENLMDLYRQGAPLDEIKHLHNIDDIADYKMLKSKYPINNPETNQWKIRAEQRQDQDTYIVKEMLIMNQRGKQGVMVPEIPTDDAIGLAKKRPSEQMSETLNGLDDTGMLEQKMQKSISGGSQSSEELVRDRLRKVPLVQPPLNRVDGVIKNFVDRVSQWAVVNKAIISSGRVLEGMGESGRMLKGLAENARYEAHAWFGQAQADMLNAFGQLKTADEYAEFVRAVNSGEDASSEVVKTAIDAYKVHQKFIEQNLIKQGTKVMMADGTSKNLGEVLQANFFPHTHKWDDILKDKDMTEEILRQLNTAYPGKFDTLSAPETLKQYVKKMQSMRMPRFSSLFERNINMPGWLGDPTTLALRGENGYKADVQDAVLGFMEDAYTMVAMNKHLGAPKGYSFTDTDLMTDLTPIHAMVKGIMEGRDVPFKNPQAVERAARRGDTTAKSIIDEVKEQYLDKHYQRDIPWKVRGLLNGIAEEGYDAEHAKDILMNIMGAKYYGHNERAVSKFLRDYNIVTKLGTLAVENIGQASFTITKTGFVNAAKALKDVVFNWKDSQEFARMSGVLVEDALRGLEADAGRSFAGSFLQKSGFRATETLLRTHAAISGKYYVKELIEKIGKNPTDVTSIRQLEKLGFNTSLFVKDGSLTEYGVNSLNSLRGTGDAALGKVIEKMAGFETSRQTQFLADILDMPSVAAHPLGKVMLQYKSFLINTTKFVLRDVMDEAKNGNYRPLVRMVSTGIAMGEITQNARALVAGEDPSTRGQVGWIRELISDDIPHEEDAAIEYLGKKWSNSDIASRLVENMIGIGYGGAFMSMMQSAMVGGKLRMLEFAAGPSVSTAVDVAQGVVSAVKGNPEQLARRVIREGTAAASGLVPFKGAAFAGSALGKNLQIASTPTQGQLERSAYVTADEYRELAMKDVEKRYREVRNRAKDAVMQGRQSEAVQFINQWNQGVAKELGILREAGALNYGTMQSIVFDRKDIAKVMQGEPEEPTPFQSTVARVQARF